MRKYKQNQCLTYLFIPCSWGLLKAIWGFIKLVNQDEVLIFKIRWLRQVYIFLKRVVRKIIIVKKRHPTFFSRGRYVTSQLSLYANHAARHVWNGEYRETLKCINHGMKILKLQQAEELWFHDVMQ
ncbi:unnamed protein product [Vicia faba]|uniref:Uncharacterized protein n=1 Tax=Vicia faba TaxID=3906 RepID=A0AAV1AGZ2_VICFA|nr:unnamed protein product [Vicia faba]